MGIIMNERHKNETGGALSLKIEKSQLMRVMSHATGRKIFSTDVSHHKILSDNLPWDTSPVL